MPPVDTSPVRRMMATAENVVHRGAQLAPQSLDENDCSVDFIIATQTPVADRSGRLPTSLLMRGAMLDRYRSNPVVLANHALDIRAVVGRTTRLWTEGGQLLARVQFDTADPDSLRAWEKVKAGYIRAASVGYRVLETSDLARGERDPESGIVGPARLAVKWELLEWSLVAVPADSGAVVRGHGHTAESERNEDMPKLSLSEILAAAVSDDQAAREAAARACLEHDRMGARDIFDKIVRFLDGQSVSASVWPQDPARREMGPETVRMAAGLSFSAELSKAVAFEVVRERSDAVERLAPTVVNDSQYVTPCRGRALGAFVGPVKPHEDPPRLNMQWPEADVQTVIFRSGFEITREYGEMRARGLGGAMELGRLLGDYLADCELGLLACRLSGRVPTGWGNMPSLYPVSTVTDGTVSYWSADAARQYGANRVEGEAFADADSVQAAANALAAQTREDGLPASHRLRQIVVPTALETTLRTVLESMGALREGPLAIEPVVLPELDALSTTEWYAGDIRRVLARKVAVPARVLMVGGDPLRDGLACLEASVCLDYWWMDATGVVQCDA